MPLHQHIEGGHSEREARVEIGPAPMHHLFKTTILGFDHGVGHPLLLLYDAKAPNCQKNKAFKELGHYSEWPKVADAVIQARSGKKLTLLLDSGGLCSCLVREA